MAFNNVVEGILTGQSEFTVTIEVKPVPAKVPPARRDTSFLWTIHPKRRLHAVADVKRHRLPFRGLSRNTDFRAWRRIVEFGRIVVGWLRCEMTYAEIEGTRLTYAEMEATEMTYEELALCEPIIT